MRTLEALLVSADQCSCVSRVSKKTCSE